MIPYTIHFIWIDQTQKEQSELSFFNVLCMKSVMIKNPKARIILHMNKPYFQPLMRGYMGKTEERIEWRRIPDTYFAEMKKIGITHVSHMSDYVRYKILNHEGGIYCDMDIVALKSFEPLLNNKCVIAKQSPAVICSGVILAEPNNPVIHDTLRQYLLDYKPDKWAYNAMTVLKENAKKYPDQCIVLKEKEGFHYPNYLRVNELLDWGINDEAPSDLYCHHIFTFSKGGQEIVHDITVNRSSWVNDPINYIEKLMKEINLSE